MSLKFNPLFLGMNAWTTEQNLELDYVLKIIHFGSCFRG